jgi:hypothetical protein
MNRTILKDIRADLTKALGEVQEKYNIELKLGSMTYSSVGFTVRLTASEKTSTGNNARYEKDWKQAVALGIVEDAWLGKVTSDGYKVIGFNFKKRKNGMILTKSGKEYVTTPEDIKKNFAIMQSS